MNNIGEHIIQQQNEDINIKYLAAQKQIYSLGKSFFATQAIIAVPIPILISLITPYLGKTQEKIAWVFILYSIAASFIEVLFDDKAGKLKKLAASIQEKFDCNVLNIEWNRTLLPNMPDDEVVFRHYRKHIKKNKLDKLYDWYSTEIKDVHTNLATIICQRTNCNYDFTLRKRYSSTILLLAIGTFALLFVISSSYGISLQTFITNALFPSLPVFILAYKQISSNKDSIENLSQLKDLIESQLSTLNINQTIDNNLIRQIQDKIYYKRILSPLLPDWVYNYLRNDLELEMHFSVTEKIRQLRL